MALKTDYKDDIFSGDRKYAQIDNGDGTVSFTDETEYDQVGDSFGATQINEIDGKINSIDTRALHGVLVHSTLLSNTVQLAHIL